MLKLIVDDSDTVNVAVNRPASQSSTSEWSVPNESGRAVSGERRGSLAFHTDVEPFPWWMVDLERVYPIDAIVIWNRDDDLAYRARSLRLHVSLDGRNWDLVHQGVTHFGGAWTARPLVHFLDGQVKARWVRVSLDEPMPLHLAQVEVLVSNNVFALEKFWQTLTAMEPQFPQIDPEALEFPYHAVKGSAPGADLTLSAFKIERYGRFGNNFQQILNATLLARQLGIHTVILPRGQLAGATPSGEAGGMRYCHEGEDDSQRALAGHFYFVDFFEAIFERISLDAILDALEHAVRPQYRHWLERVRRCADDTMHFHFRSGDVFVANTPHYTYLQPPLAHYTQALAHAVEHFGVRRAVVVYEDLNNPCVAAFIDHLKQKGMEYRACSGTLEEDAIELLGGRIICQSFGTFTESILCLSSHATAAYGFRGIESFPGHAKLRGRGVPEILARQGVALNVVSDTEKPYLARDSWKNTPEQREVMVSFAPEALTVTPVNPP